MGIWIPGGLSDGGGSGSYVPPSWSDGTDEEIVEALERHYVGDIDLTEYWSVGDTRQVTLSAMSATGVGESHAQQTVSLVLSNVGGKRLTNSAKYCVFQVDQVGCLNETGYMNNSKTNSGGWKSSKRRTWCNSTYYNAIPSTLRPIFKQFVNQSGTGGGNERGIEETDDYFALRAEIEIFNTTSYSMTYYDLYEGSQVKWYETSSNRYKPVSGAYNYWLRSPRKSATGDFCCVYSYNNTVAIGATGAAQNYGLSPFGCI